jgi:hypothetical protein
MAVLNKAFENLEEEESDVTEHSIHDTLPDQPSDNLTTVLQGPVDKTISPEYLLKLAVFDN